MRKTALVEREIEQVSCDKCGVLVGRGDGYGAYSVCSICERELCKECFGEVKQLHGLYIMPCAFCRRVKDVYAKKLRKLYKLSDQYREEGFVVQTDWAEASRRLK